jgi:hypothetical protein
MNRVAAAGRLHLMNPLLTFGVPWAIVASSFGINVAVWVLTDAGAQPRGGVSGGVASLYITVMIIYVQSMTQVLPFAMGMSLTRRTFWLGTALVAAVQALGYGIVLSALTAIEGATGGWGVRLHFWAPGVLDVDDAALQVLVSGAPMLAFAFAGVGIGVVMKRWGQVGTWVLALATLLVTGGLAILVSWRRAWGDVGAWLTDQTVLTLAVALPLGLAVVLAGLSLAGLRRLVP